MKTKASKQPKQAKPAVQFKDIKPKQNPKAEAGSNQGWGRWEGNPGKVLSA